MIGPSREGVRDILIVGSVVGVIYSIVAIIKALPELIVFAAEIVRTIFIIAEGLYSQLHRITTTMMRRFIK